MMSSLTGASGSRMGVSSNPAPSEAGVQSAMFLPLGTYRKPIRLGAVFEGDASSAQADIGPIASSHGKATAVLKPFNTVRREMGPRDMGVSCLMFFCPSKIRVTVLTIFRSFFFYKRRQARPWRLTYSLPRRIRKGSLLTISTARVENR